MPNPLAHGDRNPRERMCWRQACRQKMIPRYHSLKSSSLSAQQDLSQLYAGWLQRCGVEFTGKAGAVTPTVEISPLYALSETELKSRADLPEEITDDILLTGGKT